MAAEKKKLCVSKRIKKKKKRPKRGEKKQKENTRSEGLVKFRGTAGPYKVGQRV